MNPPEEENGIKKQVKPLCPKDDQCRDMKQLHFTATSHPQFEKFLEKKLDETLLELPTGLFNRTDRSMLLRQLKNLQKVLLRERTAEFFQKEAEASLPQPKKDPEEPLIKIDLTFEEEILPNKTTMMNSSKRPASNPPPENLKRQKTTVPEPSSADETGTNLLWKLSCCEKFDKAKTKEEREKYREIFINKMKEFNEETSHLKSPGDFIDKYEKSKPYNVFLSTVQDIQKTWNQPNSITFPEILDKSLGEIEKSFYIASGYIDIDWLRFQYLLAGQKSDSFIISSVYHFTGKLPINMEIYKYDSQYSNIIVLKYTNGVRVIVMNGLIAKEGWMNNTQVIWISPHLPFLQEGNIHLGESRTEFKKDFISYLMEYKNSWKLKMRMFEWLNLLLNVDFSPINVFFLGFVPGVYRNETGKQWGLRRLSSLLSEHAAIPSGDEADDDDADESWPIVTQTEFISRLKDQKDWFTTEFLATLSKLASSNPQNITQEFKCIYPTQENHDVFIDKNHKTKMLDYPQRFQSKQKWFNKFLYQWKTGSKGRNKSVPNGAIYTRISESKKIPWIIITSTILSSSSWGYRANCSYAYDQKIYNYDKYNAISIHQFHAGIVFFPKFLTGGKTFSVQDFDENGTPPFPIPFDVPLTPYKSTDIPFTYKAA